MNLYFQFYNISQDSARILIRRSQNTHLIHIKRRQTKMTDYEKIESAIQFIRANSHHQPSLEEISSQVNLSPFHFQKLFSQWAGISPKRFLQVLTLNNAKQLIRDTPESLLNLSDDLGLSSGSRLYDHFVQIEAVTPSEYKQAGNGLSINYGVGVTPYGKAFIAQTSRGICKLAFCVDQSIEQPKKELIDEWPKAHFERNNSQAVETLEAVFDTGPGLSIQKRAKKPLSLFVKGTNFQINVWRALIGIQSGELVSYTHIANAIDNPKATRAVGTAIGSNPIALLIPCHRVIRQSGELGGYRWGLNRKHALIAHEQAHKNKTHQ